MPLVGSDVQQIKVLEKGDEWNSGDKRMEVGRILPGSLDYYTYDGSLTTPPVTEGVRWFVLKKHIVISRRQIEVLGALYYRNNRPAQPLNARFILTNR